MSARLINELEREADKLDARGTGYKHAGERNLAGLCVAAAVGARLTIEALIELERAEGEARERGLEA